jgi:diguanylate cyclase (GGDEF)-like protein
MSPQTSSPPRPVTSSRTNARRTGSRRAARAPAVSGAPDARAGLDAFVDAAPARPRVARRSWSPSATAVLGAVVVVAVVVAVGVHHPLPLVGVAGAAVAAGAWLPRRPLLRWLALTSLITAAVAFVLGGGVSTSASGFARAALDAVIAASLVLGFGALPRSLVFGAVRAARRAAQAQADADVLKLVDDARLFRRIGARGDDDVAGQHGEQDRALLKDVSEGVAQRDRLYRLLSLAGRALSDVDVVALYALDDAGAALVLVEQVVRTHNDDGGPDATNKPRLALGGRGTGEAGVVGLVVQRRSALRVVDADGAAVRAHRATGPMPQSVLAVPVFSRSGGAPRAVVVVDRVAGRPFSDDDETFMHALGAEVVEGLDTERVVDDLDAARRRVSRVYAATRALTGVSRTGDLVDVALRAVGELCPGVAIVETSRVGTTARVLGACGPLAPLAGFSTVVDGDGFCARALAERAPLPHTALDKASPRPLLATGEALALADVGDLRAVPLFAHGEAQGVLVVAVAPGERLRGEVVDAVVAVADVLALALFSAAAFDDVERQATTDGLTGVWNRRTLDRRLDEAVARVRRSGQPLCVVLTDVDHFKSVNDTWGHATGDEVLKGVAKTLVSCARTTDVVGRLGGEEFVVVCEGTDLDGAVVVAERMRAAIKAQRFDTPRGPLSVTSSFGVALLTVDETGHAALERADQHLYKAKQQGRDRVVGG